MSFSLRFASYQIFHPVWFVILYTRTHTHTQTQRENSVAINT